MELRDWLGSEQGQSLDKIKGAQGGQNNSEDDTGRGQSQRMRGGGEDQEEESRTLPCVQQTLSEW